MASKDEHPIPVTSPKVASNPGKPDSPAGSQGAGPGGAGTSAQSLPQPPAETAAADVAMDTSPGEAVREKVGAGEEEELPYFPALPFNYFPPDVEPTVAERLQATVEPHPQPEDMSLEESESLRMFKFTISPCYGQHAHIRTHRNPTAPGEFQGTHKAQVGHH